MLRIQGLSCDQVGQAAFDGGIVVRELYAERGSLEEAFMELTRAAVEFPSNGAGPAVDKPASADV
jgi:ABC-2 type transport system ATP-binding protein